MPFGASLLKTPASQTNVKLIINPILSKAALLLTKPQPQQGARHLS